jgi:hypothetical protein
LPPHSESLNRFFLLSFYEHLILLERRSTPSRVVIIFCSKILVCVPGERFVHLLLARFIFRLEMCTADFQLLNECTMCLPVLRARFHRTQNALILLTKYDFFLSADPCTLCCQSLVRSINCHSMLKALLGHNAFTSAGGLTATFANCTLLLESPSVLLLRIHSSNLVWLYFCDSFSLHGKSS